MTEIKVVPLGAGQDVGRSCVLVSIGMKNIMFDCGMHMGFNDDRRFPDFSYINNEGGLNEFLDCVIISHFHLDHCGALPYMSEMVGFDGPIYMTHPTKAICPILLEDYRKITVDRKGETNFFTSEMIKNCMKKVTTVNLHQTVQVDDELEIKAYYAGHVLGAAMFHIKVGSQSVVYTGDYNMTPDRHLGSAWIDKCRPDLLISESTYATTIRDSKRCRERDFLKKVHDTVEKGGKVLIPVFALGRAQELCILLESYWEQMNLTAPIYFSVGLTEKATNYYKLFLQWTNQKIKSTFVKRNAFDFKHIRPFDKSFTENQSPMVVFSTPKMLRLQIVKRKLSTGLILTLVHPLFPFDKSFTENPGPMVVFSTPGMLHGGQSLGIFKKWCSDAKNMIIMPGYCVAGTIGWKVLNGVRKFEFGVPGVITEVKMSVQYMSFSAHADAKGIMQLIRMCEPRNVMLVHGEAAKMQFLIDKINVEFKKMNCYMPANGQSVSIPVIPDLTVDMAVGLLKRGFKCPTSDEPAPKKSCVMHSALVLKDNKMRLLEPRSALKELGLQEHCIRFTSTITVENEGPTTKTSEKIYKLIKNKLIGESIQQSADGSINISESVLIKVSGTEEDSEKDILVSWSLQDEDLGSTLQKILHSGLACISDPAT